MTPEGAHRGPAPPRGAGTDRTCRSPAIVTGAISGCAALGLYLWTLAPGLTSADGGDYLVAAVHLGVPHPSGYPLWTLLGWLATRLPGLAPAVATNLLSAVCSALAVAGLGVLGWRTARILGATRREAVALGCGAAMLAGVSRPIWSQAVITEVYSLHVALGVGLLAVLNAWIRSPEWRWGFAASVGALALGMSIHHLALTLIPLPLLVLCMLRPERWQEQLGGTVLASLAILRGWAGLSGDPGVIALSERLLVIGAVGSLVVLAVRRRPRAWLAAGRPVLMLVVGLLPHLYLPLAAARNPPLCWSCPTSGERFFHLTNLTSYWGSHTAALYRLVGRALGVALPGWVTGAPEPLGEASGLARWLLAEAASWVTLPVACLAVVGLSAMVRASTDQRRWLAVLGLAVLCSGFGLPFATGFDATLERQDVMRTYLGFPAAALALLGAAGAARLSVAVRRHAGERTWWVYPAVVVAAAVTAGWVNEARCSRRGADLDAALMHKLLDPLPQDAIVLAVSDTVFFGARAVVEVSSRERGSGFDRADLAVVTPARIADSAYLEELHRNYAIEPAGRVPGAPSARATLRPIALPSAAERDRRVAEASAGRGSVPPFEVGSQLTRELVVANLDTRTIVLEMPQVHPWVMDRVVPDGMWLRIEPATVAELPRELVDADLEEWDELLETFEAEPGWLGDPDLRQSVVDLRLGGVHLYRHRHLCDAAVRAAGQALRAAPESTRANAMLVDTLLLCGDPVAAQRVADAAVARDPWNPVLRRAFATLRGGRGDR